MKTFPASVVGARPVWLALLSVCVAAVASGAPPKEHFHLFLLMGQSNMAAAMPLAEADRNVADRIRVFDPAGGGTWQLVVGDDPAQAHTFPVGPGLGFAAEAARRDPGLTIGLVPLAVGGSGLVSWEKDAANYKRAGTGGPGPPRRNAQGDLVAPGGDRRIPHHCEPWQLWPAAGEHDR